MRDRYPVRRRDRESSWNGTFCRLVSRMTKTFKEWQGDGVGKRQDAAGELIPQHVPLLTLQRNKVRILDNSCFDTLFIQEQTRTRQTEPHSCQLTALDTYLPFPESNCLLVVITIHLLFEHKQTSTDILAFCRWYRMNPETPRNSSSPPGSFS